MKWHIFRRLLPQMMVRDEKEKAILSCLTPAVPPSPCSAPLPSPQLLAIIGVVICTCLTAAFLRTALHTSWSWNTAFMLGSILSATDPVAVVRAAPPAGLLERLSRTRLVTPLPHHFPHARLLFAGGVAQGARRLCEASDPD